VSVAGEDEEPEAVEPPATITCIDCGGRAHLLTRPDHDPEDTGAMRWRAGDIVTYRCADCLDRWDLVLDADDR
jgi:hypothetical protein